MKRSLALLLLLPSVPASADDVKPLPTERVEKLLAQIKPQAGEARWMEIDWHPNVAEGWRQAAKEGKPLFIWAGSGGAPAAGC